MKEYQTLIVDPAAGLSGDMFLGCMFQLGVDSERAAAAVSSLPGMDDFEIVTEEVSTRGISMKRTRVVCDTKTHSRNYRDIRKMIRESELGEGVKDCAESIFRVIAEAEGKIHGHRPEEVHFHEVGAVDSIVDIVGCAVSIAMLGFPKIYHRPFRLGQGMISIAHGEIPVPAPATLEILKGRKSRMVEEEGEIVTPTGAAIMKAAAEELPGSLVFSPGKVVYSSGTRDYGGGPGFLRITAAERAPEQRDVIILRTTLDDINPEVLGYLRERLFGRGAYEVYFTNVIMKKGRPGVEVTVICSGSIQEEIVREIFMETTTLGIRITREERVELERWMETAETPLGNIEIKFRRLPDGSADFSPEYESCRRAALKNGVAIERVYQAAREAGKDILSGSGGESK